MSIIFRPDVTIAELKDELTVLHNTCGAYERELAQLRRSTVPVSALRALRKYYVSKIDMMLLATEIKGGPILVDRVAFGRVMDEADLQRAWVLWRELAALCDQAEGKP
jgi:hypothetical protein